MRIAGIGSRMDLLAKRKGCQAGVPEHRLSGPFCCPPLYIPAISGYDGAALQIPANRRYGGRFPGARDPLQAVRRR